MLPPHSVPQSVIAPQVLTYSSTGATVLFWGLHATDIAVIMSAFASICGVLLQFYIVMHRVNRLEKSAIIVENRAAREVIAAAAIAESSRAVAKKAVDTEVRVDIVEHKVDDLEQQIGE